MRGELPCPGNGVPGHAPRPLNVMRHEEEVDVEIPLDVLVGGVVGGIFGGGAAVFTAYWGPRMLEAWRAAEEEERLHGPRKELLKKMLKDTRHEWRYLSTLAQVTGTSPEECRRLLVEVGARGASTMREEGEEELWALISRKPLNEQ